MKRKIVIEIECGNTRCENCGYAYKPHHCLIFNKEWKAAALYYKRMPECLAAETEITRLLEIEKEHWNEHSDETDCNSCPLNTWEACDEICQSKKTLIEKIAELAEGIFINKDIAEKLLKEINTHINNSCDDPRMAGRAPAYLYELQSALEMAIGETK